MMVFGFVLNGCNAGISGTYESESGVYTIKFTSSKECTWYQNGMFFNGTYEETDSGYSLEIVGSGTAANTVFIAVKDGNDLVVTGGILDHNGERFIKK
ncbi:MAG: hypothetical protein LBD49_01815 [Oscillospiraceae bacterium]|jgi:hypothetical protein|nr:hypothetical protein [Oscillospiraceae bacterium]